MGYKMKRGAAPKYKELGSSPLEYEKDPKEFIKRKSGPKVDPDAPGEPGTPGYEPAVTSMDYLTKTPVGPRAEEADALAGPKFRSPAKQKEFKVKVGKGQGSKREGKYTGETYEPEFTTKIKTDSRGREYTTEEDTGKIIYIQKGTPKKEGYVEGGERRTAASK